VALPVYYPLGTRVSFPGGKATGTWSWPLSSIYSRGQECVGLYLHCRNTPSWRGAELKHRDIILPYLTFTFLYFILYRHICPLLHLSIFNFQRPESNGQISDVSSAMKTSLSLH